MYLKHFTNGIYKQNPLLVLVLGVCPALAVSYICCECTGNGNCHYICPFFSNFFISAIKNFIPDGVRIPSFIIIIATFVTITELLLQAYFQKLYDSLGIYVSLIVVNCIVLGRAEVFARRNNILASLMDALGMGLGFTVGIVIIGSIREILRQWFDI